MSEASARSKPEPVRYAIEPDHHIKSRIEPGTVFSSHRSNQSGTIIEHYRKLDGLFVAICRDHGYESKPARYRADAERASKHPGVWCEGCRELLGVPKEVEQTEPALASAKLCEVCGEYRMTVAAHGHLRSPDKITSCRECRQSEKFREMYEKRFGYLVEASRSEWKGMSRRERKMKLKRIAKTWEAEHGHA
jgi:hypothetical protein